MVMSGGVSRALDAIEGDDAGSHLRWPVSIFKCRTEWRGGWLKDRGII